MNHLEQTLTELRSAGRKLVVPYITGGFPANWPELISGLANAGSDAIEVGIPFSDPVMDGPTIQESSSKALEAGITPEQILAEVGKLESSVPLVAMTYYNICFQMGHQEFAQGLSQAGFSGAILPDLALEESADWREQANANSIDSILLAAPTSTDERLAEIVEASSGFVYAVGLVGTTGERSSLADSAIQIAKRVKQVTDKPVLVGVGISTPEQAKQVSEVADGVIIGSAIIRTMLETGSINGAIELVGEIREALN